jgi:hypothetical protein
MYNVLFYLVKLLHFLIKFAFICLPFITKDKNILAMIIILNIVIVTSWRIHGHCFLIDIEEYLENKKSKQNNTEKQLNNPHKVGTISQTILNEFPFSSEIKIKIEPLRKLCKTLM